MEIFLQKFGILLKSGHTITLNGESMESFRTQSGFDIPAAPEAPQESAVSGTHQFPTY